MKLEKFFENKLVVVLFFRTGLYTFPSSKYKTFTLSKLTEAWQNSNIVCILVQMSLHTAFHLPILCSVPEIYIHPH